MKRITSTLVSSLVLALLLSLSSCISYEDVEFSGISNYEVKEMSISGIEVELEALINNPNSYKITIMDYDLDLYVDGKRMGKAEIDKRLVLPKRTEKAHTFTVTAKFKNALTGGLAGAIGFLSKTEMEVEVKGHIKAKAMGIKKSVPIEFSEVVAVR